ncbi:hypothetical protein MRB53_031996 [Persea americana]|uniref:Uncharacterized protein n=1 Tax=Persea americana TaxID=3435 RepID=A0ACC2KR01_PERAE|nr:hypothetical protein MRB53_031996 [Persea americana]
MRSALTSTHHREYRRGFEDSWFGRWCRNRKQSKRRFRASISPEKIVQIRTTSPPSVTLLQLETTALCPTSPEIEKNRRRLPFPNFWLQSSRIEDKTQLGQFPLSSEVESFMGREMGGRWMKVMEGKGWLHFI